MNNTNNKKTTKKTSFLDALNINIGSASLANISFFAQTMSMMLKSGITMSEALTIAKESSSGKLKSILGKVSLSTQSGHSLSSSLKEYPNVFSSFFVNAIKIGESSGTLTENLDNLSAQLKKDRALSAKIKGAMLYPAVVLSAAAIIGLLIAFLVLPKITPVLESLRIDLPLATQVLIWISNLIKNHGIIIIICIAIISIFLNWFFRQKFVQPATHWIALRIPIVKGISGNSNLSRFCRTLGTLIKSGINIDEAIKITKDSTSNFYYKKALTDIYERTSKGVKLSNSLKQYNNLFPQVVIKMIRAGEESGKLHESLIFLADFYEEKVDVSAQRLSATIEPILLLILGLIVSFLALSIISPIFKATGGIR
ncbi:type II secretion system F family protein [Patescibacteria group bacterium]